MSAGRAAVYRAQRPSPGRRSAHRENAGRAHRARERAWTSRSRTVRGAPPFRPPRDRGTRRREPACRQPGRRTTLARRPLEPQRPATIRRTARPAAARSHDPGRVRRPRPARRAESPGLHRFCEIRARSSEPATSGDERSAPAHAAHLEAASSHRIGKPGRVSLERRYQPCRQRGRERRAARETDRGEQPVMVESDGVHGERERDAVRRRAASAPS